MKLTILENPKYEVDLERTLSPAMSNDWQGETSIVDVAKSALAYLQQAQEAFVKACMHVYSCKRFILTNIFLYGHRFGSYIPDDNLYVIGLRVYSLFLNVFVNVFIQFVRILLNTSNHNISEQDYLQRIAGEQIHCGHLKTDLKAIDTSNVPADIHLDQLMDMFESINFDQPDQPGYMSPLARTEKNRELSVSDLRGHLETLIHNVKERVPFIGTPPAEDTERLNAFYQQIEDAVRVAIHKVLADLEDFESKNEKPYSGQTLNKYKDLMENKSRVALDLAIAGQHCGTRYMGVAMRTYWSVMGDVKIDQETLKGALTEILAHRRREIAEIQVLKESVNAHDFTLFMQTLGPILGLPGTENIIEHLSDDSLDRDYYLNKFFSEYTDDEVISTVQNKIKTSIELRYKITDWLKDQVGEWKKNGSQDQIKYVIKAINQTKAMTVSKDEIQQTSFWASLSAIKGFIEKLKREHKELPTSSNTDDFVDELISHSDFKKQFEKIQDRHQIKTDCCHLLLAPIIKEQIRESQSINLEELVDKIRTIELIKIIRKRFRDDEIKIQLDDQTLDRILTGHTQVDEVVKSRMHNQRAEDFLASLAETYLLDKLGDHTDNDDNKIKGKGLPPILIEWLLVSHEILLPQEQLILNPDSKLDNNNRMIISTSNNKKLIIEELNLDTEQQIFDLDNSNGRYRPYDPNQTVPIKHFNIAYDYEADRMIRIAKNQKDSEPIIDPLWKRITHIQIPRILGSLLRNRIALALITITAASYFSYYGLFFHNRTSDFLAFKVEPILASCSPLICLRIGRCVATFFKWVKNNKFQIFAVAFIAKSVLQRITGSNVQRFFKKFNINYILTFGLFPPSLVIRWHATWMAVAFVQSVKTIGLHLLSIGNQASRKRHEALKKWTFKAWTRPLVFYS